MEKTGLVIISIIAILIAAVCFLGDEHIPEGFWHTLLHEIGFALLVSVIIWGLFEIRKSQAMDDEWDDRIKRITQNVFFAVLRKDLPKEIINEANSVALSQSLLRSNFSVVYTFRDHNYQASPAQNADCVLVSGVVSFRMSNIGSETTFYDAAISLPNPIHPELKKLVTVHALTLTQDGRSLPTDISESDAKSAFAKQLESEANTLVSYSVGKISLVPGATVEFRADYVMAKECEDTELLQTAYPSDGLTVTVTDQASDATRLVFARSVHRVALENQSSMGSPNTKIFRIAGYLLPHQGVLIWWKRSPAAILQKGCSRSTIELDRGRPKG